MIAYKHIMYLMVILSMVCITDDAEARKRKKHRFKWPPKDTIVQTPADNNKTTPDMKDGISNNNSPKSNSDDKAFKDPFAEQYWTMEDVKRMCSNNSRGPRGYQSCIERNGRRVGRIKSPYDNNRIR